MTLLRLPALLLASAMLFASWTARADDVQDTTRLLRQGQPAQALDRINQYLAGKPRDPQGRFLKGLILAEQNKSAEAIDVFTALTKDYPELPEPYNNLAVLFAAQGQYEKARQSLEQSIRTHPSYATAYENLGDVYTKLASQAYDKALQLDSSNTSAQTKLAMVRDMVPTNGNRPPPRPTTTARNDTPPAPAAAPAPATPAPAPAAKAAPPTVVAVAPKAAPAAEPKPAPAAKAPEKAAEPKAPEKVPKSKLGAAGGNEEVAKAVRSWAAAWASKDVKAYVGHYAKNFQTPKGEPRAQWEQERETRIKAPKEIEVGVDNLKISMQDENSARASFRQAYRSDKLKISSNKTLVMTRADGRWLIREERVGN